MYLLRSGDGHEFERGLPDSPRALTEMLSLTSASNTSNSAGQASLGSRKNFRLPLPRKETST